jgi:predicted acetyltransferase
VGTLATEPRTLTVPTAGAGTADLAADALTAVTVAATHRRRGLLTQMIGQSLQQAADRGDALSMLIAAEWPIYGRFGYAPATRGSDYTLHTRWAGAQVQPDPSGTVRHIDADELGKDASAIFDAARRRRAGQVDRPGDWWARRLGLDGYQPFSNSRGTWILHETDGEPDGFLCWRVSQDFELSGEYGVIKVLEHVAGSETAYRNLWAYLCSLDVIGQAKLSRRAVDEPVRWLLADGRSLQQEYTGDDLWLRLLDVPAALSARGYSGADTLVLDVVDEDLGGFAAGRYRLDVSPDGVSCERTTDTPDLRLPQRTLASAYLGDQSIRTLAIAGGVDELTPGAVARADALFTTALAPWNNTGF